LFSFKQFRAEEVFLLLIINLKKHMKKILYLLVTFAIMALPANAANLITNGDFETPEVTTTQKWDIYDSGYSGLGWIVEWADSYVGAPDPAHLELHRGVNNWAPYEGSQHAELDTDWQGPGGASGEEASVRIYQDIDTCTTATYTVSYAWSPRPGESDNAIEVYWDGGLLATHSEDGSSNANTVWTLESHTGLSATGSITRLEFIETGTPNSLGMFLDAVSVEQTSPCEYTYACEDGMLHTDARSDEADLYLVDPATGTGELKLTYQGDYRNTLAADSTGTVYAIDRANGNLVILNPDATVTVVGATGFGSTAIGTLGFAPDDKLYVALNDDTLWEISTADGSATKLTDLVTADVQGGDIVIDEENFMVIVNTSGQVYTVDLAAGYTETHVGTLPAGGQSYTGMVLISGVYYVTSQNNNSLYSFILPFGSVTGPYGHMFTTNYAHSGDSASCAVERGEAGIDVVKTVKGLTPPYEIFTGEEVTYIYTVTNTGELALNTVNISDDKCSPITGPSGDTNTNGKLDIDETWVYECTTNLYETTDNTVTVTAKDPFGDEVSAQDSVNVVVKELGCTMTQGYWKNHDIDSNHPDENWDGKEDDPFFLSGQSWYEVLTTAPKEGNAYYILAHQYIAAELNNAYMPTEVQNALDTATTLFETYTPAEIGALKGSNLLRQEFIELAGILGDYNEGLIGPGHCSDVEEEAWNLEGSWVLRFILGGNWDHDMTVDSQTDGNFSGTGGYPAGGAHTHTWNVTGTVSGDNVSFHIVYLTGNPGYELWADGTIAADGSMNGTWHATGQPGPYNWMTLSGTAESSSNQEFTWETTSGTVLKQVVEYKNHGQYVRSQENKREAAHSRIGMPVQSKGHTK
jgi:hypothetical protein